MFYSVSLNTKTNYPHQYQLGPYIVGTDSGWVKSGNTLFKGYADNFNLADNLEAIKSEVEPTNTGNYTVLFYNGTTLTIHTDKFRSYPLYVKDNEVTNLDPGGTTIWADSVVTINPDLTTVERKFDLVGPIDTSPLLFDQALDQVDEILTNKVKNFLSHNTTPIRAFTSGGVDSTLVLSYLHKHTHNYELVKCAHIDYDKFWLQNFITLKTNYWGYRQIHHWTTPAILTSGTPGDEFMLRSPTTVNWLLRNNGLTMAQLLDQYPTCLHSDYFSNYTDTFNTEFKTVTQEQLVYQICNTVANDWQHWHIGNTLTWTPLRDLDITKIMLRVPVDQLLGQIMDSSFSRSLILRTTPQLNKVISDKKNSGNYMSNLVTLYEQGIV